MRERLRTLGGSSGQSLVEFAVMLPLVLLIVLGVVEVGYAVLDQQVVTRLTREGSNLISRDTSLADAATAISTITSRPVNLANGSRMIFSVLRKGATTGTANYNQIVLYQRYVFGNYTGTSKLITAGSGSFRGAPDYEANQRRHQYRAPGDERAQQSGREPGGHDLRDRAVHAPHADHAARTTSASRCRRRSTRLPTFSTGGCARFPQKVTHMTRYKRGWASGEEGFAVVYMAVVLTLMLVFTGLAVDSGRGYVVKAQLSKAVDGAALGAARALNNGNPRAEAVAIFKANFPPDYFGTVGPDPTTASDFFSLTTDTTTGVNTVAVKASAQLPTTFMKLANFQVLNVRSTGEATRRMVDLSLVIDVSSSIGGQLGRGQRRDPGLHQFVRRERRPHVADAVRQRRRGHGAHAARSRVQRRPPCSLTCPILCPAAARTWSRACIAGGTRSGRWPTASSRACASSSCSPTAPPTACQGSTAGRPRGRSEPTTSRTTAPILATRPTSDRTFPDSMTRRSWRAAPASRTFNLWTGAATVSRLHLPPLTIVSPVTCISLSATEAGTTPIEARASRTSSTSRPRR